MLVVFIAALVSQTADYDMPCDTCVGDFSGEGGSATKVWCPLAGCVTGNTVAARSLCGDETIIYQKAFCRARNTRPASCRVTGPLKKTCSCPEGKGQDQCRSLLSKRLSTVTFEEPMGRLAAETYTQKEFSQRATFTVLESVCQKGSSLIREGCPTVQTECSLCDRCEWDATEKTCELKTAYTKAKQFDDTCVIKQLFEALDDDADDELSLNFEFTPENPKGKLLPNSYMMGSLKSQGIGSTAAGENSVRRRLAHIPAAVADVTKMCEPCVGSYEGTPEAATKVWCPEAGCVNGNVAKALMWCGNNKDLIAVTKPDCENFWDPNNIHDDSNNAEEHYWAWSSNYVGGYPLYKATVAQIDLSACLKPTAQSAGTEVYDIEVTMSNAVAKPELSITSVFPHLRKFEWKGSRQGLDQAAATGAAGSGLWNSMDRLGVDPTMWGLTIEQFKAFVDACKKEPLWDIIKAGSRKPGHIGYNPFKQHDVVSGYDIDAFFVKPWTKNTGEGVALNLNYGAPKRADVMISHAWGEDMEQVAEMLTELTERPNKPVTKDTVIWFCIFSNYQAGDFDVPYATKVVGRTGDGELLGPTVSAQVAMDPFEKVIAQDNVKQMISLQVAELDLYTRLWCILELDTALKKHKQVVLVTSERYQKMHLPDIMHANASHSQAKWESLRPNSEKASAGFLRDVILIVQKLLSINPDEDDPLKHPLNKDGLVENGCLRTATGCWPGYVGASGVIDEDFKKETYSEVNQVMWDHENADKWAAATGRQQAIWNGWERWWAIKKNAPRWACINDNIEVWRKEQFKEIIKQLTRPISVPWKIKLKEVTVDGDHYKATPNGQEAYWMNLPMPADITSCSRRRLNSF